MIRKTIFWLHLGTGVVVGLVVAMMSVTGVLLTYEHQLISRADRSFYPVTQPGANRLRVEQIVAAAASANVTAKQLTYSIDPRVPVLAGGGRREPSTYVDAYTGDVLGTPTNATRDAMSTLTRWHRWFNAEGEARDIGAWVTGVSNLAFLFLILSGAYLWLPRIMRWPLFRQRLRFAQHYKNAKERDYYWHHVFGSWALVPLAVVVATAVVFSFSWADELVRTIAGTDPVDQDNGVAEIAVASRSGDRLSLDALLEIAVHNADGWKTIALAIPETDDETVSFSIDTGSGRQPQKRQTMVLDAWNGAIIEHKSFSDQPPGARARTLIRYLHTGEAYGFTGQTIAGLVSFASLFMVWTGFALSWRRLIRPLLRRT